MACSFRADLDWMSPYLDFNMKVERGDRYLFVPMGGREHTHTTAALLRLAVWYGSTTSILDASEYNVIRVFAQIYE